MRARIAMHMARSYFAPLLVLCALLIAAAGAAADTPRYTVRLDGDTLQAHVELCLAQPHAQVKFDADSDGAMRFIEGIRRSGTSSVTADESAWTAADWAAGECLSYRADLNAIAAEHDQDAGWKIGTDILTAPQLWLLRPDAQGEDGADLRITLPEGLAISAPWQLVGRDGGSTHFHIANTPANWSAAVAIGHFKEERIEMPGGAL